MSDPILAKVYRWAANDTDRDLEEISSQIQFMEEKLYHDYEPTKGPYPRFWQRLNRWLDNVSEDDQKTLLRLVPDLFFIGREEFDALYRTAYNGPIARWLIDQNGMNLDDFAIEQRLRDSVAKTWFCPVTDSMRINAFYHINQIPATHEYRPDWRSLAKFGSVEKIKKYISHKEIKHIVLLEDFVGSGNQVKGTIEFAANIGLSLLFLPIIACPAAIKVGRELEERYPEIVTFEQALSLTEKVFIKPRPVIDELSNAQDIRDLVIRTYDNVCGGPGPHNDEEKPYGPYGYKGAEGTGGLIVMYSNCPNNSLPIIHHESTNWQPLFPRSARA